MQPEQPNQYDFIMNPGSQRTSGPAFLQNPKGRILASIIFVSVILIVIIIGFNIITNLGKQSNDDMLDVVAWQTEILRITELGLKEAKDPNTRTQISTLNSFLISDNYSTKSYITSSGTKIEPFQLSAQKDNDVEQELSSATQLNRYDETLLKILNEKTASYKASLSSALGNSTAKRKNVLETAATNILTYEGVELSSN